MRTIVDLPDEQIEALKRISDAFHLSRAELRRRAVAEYLSRHQSSVTDEAFGLWKRHQTDGVAYQKQIRAEWER
jgi:predicted transcriptional regulator